ncbi:MAG: hypothetical protein HY208_04170 [Nitrospirae bacterium]|nr:hypothetical protein [Nitrospirota bacterium]
MSATDALKPATPAVLAAPGLWGGRLAGFKGPLLVIMLLLGLQAALYLWWMAPTSAALAAQEIRSREIRTQIQALFLYQDQHRRLDALTKRFPSKKLLPKTIGRLSSIGQRVGVAIPEMNFVPAKIASPNWAKVILQFNARGSYASVRRLLAALEGGAEPFVIESIDLQKDRLSGQVIAKLSVGVYARDDE